MPNHAEDIREKQQSSRMEYRIKWTNTDPESVNHGSVSYSMTMSAREAISLVISTRERHVRNRLKMDGRIQSRLVPEWVDDPIDAERPKMYTLDEVLHLFGLSREDLEAEQKQEDIYNGS